MTRWDTEGTCPYGKVVGMYVCVCRSNGSRGKLLLERASEGIDAMLCVPFAWQLSLANQWASMER